MKSVLRVAEHTVLPDTLVFEVWYDGQFLATVTGADGPGVRIHSRHFPGGNPSEVLPETIEIPLQPPPR